MTIRVKNKAKLVVPTSVRRRAGIKAGDRLEFKVSGGVINIIPKLPTADDEYTPQQRRIIDARLAQSAEDVKQGRTYGPFDSADVAIKFLHKEIRVRKTSKKKTAKR